MSAGVSGRDRLAGSNQPLVHNRKVTRMATQNRSLQIKQALKVLRRHYKGADPQPGLSTFEYLLFACCLENSPHEAAERACANLKKQYYDWNEVRVSSIGELAESLKMLNDPEDGARRHRS